MMTAANTMDHKERNSHQETRGRFTPKWEFIPRAQEEEMGEAGTVLQSMDHRRHLQRASDDGERAGDTGAGCAEGMWTARTRVVDAEPMAAVTLE